VSIFLAVTIALSVVLFAITVIDMRTFRIPDLLSLPLIAAGLGVAVWQPVLPFLDHLIGALAGFAIFAAIGAWYYQRTGVDGLGLGDAKLFAAAGAWLGWQALPATLLIAALGGIAFALSRSKTRRSGPIAFGPWLAFGFWVLWIWQHTDQFKI
jgi:leader peptidase (prepilin peptidase) / N-methyltransferase